MIPKIRYFLVILGLSAALAGCLGTKHLKDNEKLLYRQSVNTPRKVSGEALRSLYAQRPNRKLLGLPIAPLVGIYYWGERNYDQEKYIRKKDKIEKKFDNKIQATTSEKKINNYQFRKQKKLDRVNSFLENGNLRMQWGEPVSVYDSAMVTLTRERFHDYLFNKGYFQNKVTSKIFAPLGRFVNVTYKINTGPGYVIDSILYEMEDTTVLRIIKENQKQSFIKKGDLCDQDKITRERERIDLLLRDHGYYDFSRQYIDFDIDSSFFHPEKKVAIMMIVKDPAKRGYHKQFTVDSVNFITDAGIVLPGFTRKKRSYRDIQYQYYTDNFKLNILSQRVFLRPGELYSRTKTINTQRQLANVDAFKFININYDTAKGRFIANVSSSPLPRYEWTNEAGVNVTQGYPGPFYNISFKKRNIFRGLESFDLSGRFGFEGVASATSDQNFYKSTEAGANASLTFPKFIWPFSERTRFRQAQYNPKTKLTIGYGYTSRPEYIRTAVILNGTYSWQNNRNRSFYLTPFSMSIIDVSKISPQFGNLLLEQVNLGNYSLLYSFVPSFVNSIIFGVTWNYNNYGNLEKNSGFVRAQIESGGTIWNLIKPTFIEDQGWSYFKYLRLSVDMRRINILDRNTILAYRFNSGISYSYGPNQSLPYEKFFFVGGSNSIRAWRPRRLGPGSLQSNRNANPAANGYFNYSIEQPAEILIEGSIELRQKLFGFVSGAVFVDAGNVWTFRERNPTRTSIDITPLDPIRPQPEPQNPNTVPTGKSKFYIDEFYKQVGIGTGFGLRFDFTFLILRLDVGIKAYDPAREKSDRFVLDKVRFRKPYATQQEDGSYTNFREPVIYNVGIGYSF